MDSLRFLVDSELLSECRMEIMRGSGPGGQKRNKTSNFIRLTHEPTGIVVTAGESRSLVQNKSAAIRRLRLKLAIQIREEIDLAHFDPPEWFRQIRQNNRIAASSRHRHYHAAAGLVLDLMHSLSGNPAAIAAMLGISTSAVIRFLENEPSLWTAANRMRAENGVRPLAHRRG